MSFVAFFISLLFQLLLFSQNAEMVPTFTSQPSATVEEGQNLFLQWSYNLDGQAFFFAVFSNTTDGFVGAPTVAAKRENENVTVSSGYEQHFSAAISDTQATLTIRAVPRSINGEKYRFTITTGSFVVLASNDVVISVLYAPYITDISNQTFNEGDSVTLNDCASGNPQPNSTWTRLSNNSVVTFPFNIKRQDEGGYNCTADNGVGSPASGVAFITVHYKPENVRLVTNATANKVCQGDTLKFTCSADGKPMVHTYQLFEDEVPLESGSSGMSIKTLSNNGDLPNQTYKCVANNTVGTANSQNVSIFVGVPSSIQMIQDEVVTEGGDLNLSCIADGTSSLLVSWINSSGHRHNGNVLELTNIDRSEAGEYRCEASNECGNSSEAVNINVQYPPEIISAPSPQPVVEGNGVTLVCNATGNPQPNITWTKQGGSTVLSRSETFHLPNLTSEDNGAVYICKVKNILDSREANYTITVLYAPNVTIQQCSTPVHEGESVTLYCNATGNPGPSTAWIKKSTGEVLYNETLILPNIKRNESGSYECLAWNGIGNNSTKFCTIDVYYRPSSSNLTTVPSNTTVLRGKTLSLICSTDANPLNSVTYHFYFNDRYIGNSSSGVLNTTVEADGVYKCVPINTVGSGENATVSITAVVAPSAEVNKTTDTVVEGNRITLFCNASGKPKPTSITWIRVGGSYEILSNTSILTVMNVSRPGTPDNMIQYQCTASNGVESPATAVSNITVHYPPKITRPKADTNITESGAIIKCDAEGNPSPTYVWRNGTGGVVANEETFTLTYDGNYTCIASNTLGFDTHSIVIEIPSDYYHGEVPVEELNGVAVDFNPEFNNLNSPPAIEFITKFGNEMDKLYANDSTYNRTEVTGLSKGSVIVSFVLYFTTPVTASKGLAKLKAATDNGTLGPFTVGALKIIQNVNPTSTPSVSSTGSTTAIPPVVTTKPTDPPPPWIIIGAVVGGVVVMVIIIAVVAWCVHKKRKCRRKGTKIGNSESDVPVEGLVNGGYADSGPPSANGANRTDASVLLHEQPTAAAPPTYAVVDKKKKKEKKGDKKEDHNVAKQDVPDYAVVDKSQKKKKEVVEDAYAQVDMSKKSKKKPKPGEMLYADLGDFKPTQMQPTQMPAVSTSPEPLPPIKRPPAYEETQYADITQFMTGNATLPETNNSQGTEMTYANVEGGKEKPKGTAKEGGNEEKPKETRM